MATRDATNAPGSTRRGRAVRVRQGSGGRCLPGWPAALMVVVGLSLTGIGMSPTASATGAAPSYTLSVIAGITAYPHAGPAMASSLQAPLGLARDAAGNLYIADDANNLVEKVTPAGQLSIIGGTGLQGPIVNGPARSTSIVQPNAIAVDLLGDVFVSSNYQVVKIASSGILTLIAGNGHSGWAQPGSALSSPFEYITALASSPNGNLYIANGDEVDRVAPNGVVAVTAGTHVAGPPIEGPATASQLNSPSALAVNQTTRNLYIADSGNNVVEEVAGGYLTIVAGNGSVSNPVAGAAKATSVPYPAALAIDSAGRLYVGAWYHDVQASNYYGYVLDVSSGQLSVQGVGNAYINGLASAGSGSVFYDPAGSAQVLRLSALGIPTAYAGNAWFRCDTCVAPRGPATHEALDAPTAVAMDAAGNTYIVDGNAAVLYKRSPLGVLTVVAGRSLLVDPTGVAVDAHGVVFLADYRKKLIFRIRPGASPTVAVNAGADGIAPYAVAVDAYDNLYVTDLNGCTLRRITPAGVITLLAGTTSCGIPAPGAATASKLQWPNGVAVDLHGNVYVISASDRTMPGTPDLLLKITPRGALSVMASVAANRERDGGLAGVAVDRWGNVYLADSHANQILKDSPLTGLRVIAGNGTYDTAKAGPALASGLYPYGVAVDPVGNVYVADYNAAVEKLSLPFIKATTRSAIYGTYLVGHRLSVSLGHFSVSGVTVGYQWLANGVAIRGATHSYLVLTTAQRHKTISVRITASKQGFNPYRGIVPGGYVR